MTQNDTDSSTKHRTSIIPVSNTLTCRDHQRQRGGRGRLDDLVERSGALCSRVFVVSRQQPMASPASRQVADGSRSRRRVAVGYAFRSSAVTAVTSGTAVTHVA